MKNRIAFGSAGTVALSLLAVVGACSSSSSSKSDGINVCGSDGCDGGAALADQWAPFLDGPGIVDSPTFDATAPFAITVAPAAVGVPLGGSYHFTVTVTRTPGFTGPITVALEKLPAHVTSFSTAIGAGATSGELTVSADAMATLGTTMARVGAGGGSGFTYSDVSLSVNPASGTLDTSFGSSGTVNTDMGGCDARGIAVLPDGSFVVGSCGYNGAKYVPTLARFTAAGVLDSTFATGGKTAPDFTGPSLRPLAFLRQTDGSFVFAGEAAPSYDVFVARYLANGAIDTAFATAGVNTISQAGPGSSARGMALQTDGKIVLAGSSQGGGLGIALARVGTDGTLDATFGVSGAIPVVHTNNESAAAVALQPDGSIVVAGVAYDAQGFGHSLVARYTAAGVLDASFGTGGRVVLTLSPSGDSLTSVYVQPDGGIVASGSAYEVSGGHGFRVVRLTKLGTLDPAFGDHGVAKAHFAETSDDFPAALVRAAEGSLVVAGTSFPTALPLVVAVARFTPNGGLDTSFGTAGIVTLGAGANTAAASSIALQADGRMLIGGGTVNSSQLFLARYWP